MIADRHYICLARLRFRPLLWLPLPMCAGFLRGSYCSFLRSRPRSPVSPAPFYFRRFAWLPLLSVLVHTALRARDIVIPALLQKWRLLLLRSNRRAILIPA